MTGTTAGGAATSVAVAIRAATDADLIALLHDDGDGARLTSWWGTRRRDDRSLLSRPAVEAWLGEVHAGAAAWRPLPLMLLRALPTTPALPGLLRCVRMPGDRLAAVLLGWSRDDGVVPDDEVITPLACALAEVHATEDTLAGLHRQVGDARREARTDVLTGLCNRRGWLDALANAEASLQRPGIALHAAVGVVDLDGLKAVNDRDGHRAGDRLIRCAAALIADSSPEWTCAARTGGDEFAVLHIGRPIGRFGVRDRLTHLLAGGGVRGSVGAAVHTPGQPLTAAWDAADADLLHPLDSRRTDRSS